MSEKEYALATVNKNIYQKIQFTTMNGKGYSTDLK